jgi:hypothetical protein
MRRLDRHSERVLKTIRLREQTANRGQLDQLRGAELFGNLGEYVIAASRSVARNVLGPKHRGTFPRGKLRRGQIIAQADRSDLLIRDTGRLTKRRVVRNSIRAAVDVTGLENRHFLDSAGQNATATLALDPDAGEQLKACNAWYMPPNCS